jgi:hypothetical protein
MQRMAEKAVLLAILLATSSSAGSQPFFPERPENRVVVLDEAGMIDEGDRGKSKASSTTPSSIPPFPSWWSPWKAGAVTPSDPRPSSNTPGGFSITGASGFLETTMAYYCLL